MNNKGKISFNELVSELPNLDKDVKFAYGVKVDEYSSDTNSNLKDVGFLGACDEDDPENISLDVIDSILSYSTFDSSVILEIPNDLNLDPSSLVIMANTTRFDLSILPPKSLRDDLNDDNKRDADDYISKIISYCDPWFNNPTGVSSIYPFTGYFAYLIGNELGYKPDSITTDRYMNIRFVESMSISVMDYIKEHLTHYIYEVMGGETEFQKYAHTLAAIIYRQVEEIADEFESSNKNQ